MQDDGLTSMALARRIEELERALEERSAQLLETKERLAQCEATMSSLSRAAPIGIGLVENRILGWVNGEMLRLTGRSEAELRGQSARILYPSDEEFRRVGRLKHADVARSGIGSVETRWMHRDGTIRPIFLSSAAIDPEDPMAAMVFTALDISEQKETEQALRRSEGNYRSLIRNAVYGIYRSNPEGHFLEVNPALVRMLGYESREELLTANIARDIYQNPADRTELIARVWNREVINGVHVLWKKKDGTPIEVRTSGRVLRGDNGLPEGWEMIVEDITERSKLEDQLRQSQKLEALGRLAGGVAHDFNNLLTAIGGYSEMLQGEVDEDDPLRCRIDGIHEASMRAASLTRQLLAFSRKQILHAEALDLNGVVSGLEPMLRRLIGEDIDLVIDPGIGLAHVFADRGQVEQIVMNLVVNARDAMPGGGTLTIRTRYEQLGDPDVAARLGVRAGDYVRLDVEDTGLGMEPEVMARAFEPFFTTKERDRGTGLGLSTVYGIAKQSGGCARVLSSPGKGATLTVFLPGTDEAATGSAKAGDAHHWQAMTGTILVVEDEPAVRELVSEILEMEGLTVLVAGNAEQAFQVSSEYDGTIDLLLSDVVLPGPDGPEIAEELQRRRPGLPVLFMSGYAGDVIDHRGTLDRDGPLLEKPFTAKELTSRIADILS